MHVLNRIRREFDGTARRIDGILQMALFGGRVGDDGGGFETQQAMNSVNKRRVRRSIFSGANLLEKLHRLGVVTAAVRGESALTLEFDGGVIRTVGWGRREFDLARVVMIGVGIGRGGAVGGEEGGVRHRRVLGARRRVSLFVAHGLSSYKSDSRA